MSWLERNAINVMEIKIEMKSEAPLWNKCSLTDSTWEEALVSVMCMELD